MSHILKKVTNMKLTKYHFQYRICKILRILLLINPFAILGSILYFTSVALDFLSEVLIKLHHNILGKIDNMLIKKMKYIKTQYQQNKKS